MARVCRGYECGLETGRPGLEGCVMLSKFLVFDSQFLRNGENHRLSHRVVLKIKRDVACELEHMVSTHYQHSYRSFHSKFGTSWFCDSKS